VPIASPRLPRASQCGTFEGFQGSFGSILDIVGGYKVNVTMVCCSRAAQGSVELDGKGVDGTDKERIG